MEMSPTPTSAPAGSKNKNAGIIVAIIVIILAGGAYLLMQGNKTQAPSESVSQVVTDEIQPEPVVPPSETPPEQIPPPSAATTPAETAPQPNIATPPQEDINTATAPTEEPSVKSFSVIGGNFSFTPNEMKVKKGDTVKVTFINNEGFHDWVLDEFNVRTPQIGEGKNASVEFVASKTGSFEYYCSVGSHRKMGMKGTLIVE